MKSWHGYKGHFVSEIFNLRLTVLEKALISSLVLMCLISAVSSMLGRNVGNYEELKMAKLRAQQELMALRMEQSK